MRFVMINKIVINTINQIVDTIKMLQVSFYSLVLNVKRHFNFKIEGITYSVRGYKI